jgi:solute carrier family 5 (sodium-coupled monocarboxylate transporter), member 8/12
MSTGLNTLAGTIYEDFLRHLFPKASEKRASDIMKFLVVSLGLLMLSLVFIVEKMGQVFRISIAVSGLTAGALLGMFTIGMISRYVNTKGIIAGAVVSMLSVGFIMIGAQSLPKHPPLPTRVDGCEFSFNATMSTMIHHDDAEDEIPLIFKLSFMYYTFLGAVLLIFVAYIISWWTGGSEPFDERLLAPFRRSKNWQLKENELKKDAMYSEIKELKELKAVPDLVERRMSIDVA